jgi:hypothetical protein
MKSKSQSAHRASENNVLGSNVPGSNVSVPETNVNVPGSSHIFLETVSKLNHQLDNFTSTCDLMAKIKEQAEVIEQQKLVLGAMSYKIESITHFLLELSNSRKKIVDSINEQRIILNDYGNGLANHSTRLDVLEYYAPASYNHATSPWCPIKNRID